MRDHRSTDDTAPAQHIHCGGPCPSQPAGRDATERHTGEYRPGGDASCTKTAQSGGTCMPVHPRSVPAKSPLLTPFSMGSFKLDLRMVYAPLTRCRALGEHLHTNVSRQVLGSLSQVETSQAFQRVIRYSSMIISTVGMSLLTYRAIPQTTKSRPIEGAEALVYRITDVKL